MVEALLTSKNHFIDLATLYDMFGRWDSEFGFDQRPKSDFVTRMLMRVSGQKAPKCRWLGWDGRPLTDWSYKRTTLRELALEAKECMPRMQSDSED